MINRNKDDWPNIKHIHTIVFDFDGVFTNNKVYVNEDGRESIRCDRADGLAIDFLRRYCKSRSLDLDFFILSKERNQVVAARAQKLQLECKQGVSDKLSFIAEYLKSQRPETANPFSKLIYLGNDLNDLPVIERAGFSVVPNDAHPIVKRVATAVLPQNGGQGFVRAVVERLLRINNMTLEEIHEFVSDC